MQPEAAKAAVATRTKSSFLLHMFIVADWGLTIELSGSRRG
jgi:hypothetical protein